MENMPGQSLSVWGSPNGFSDKLIEEARKSLGAVFHREFNTAEAAEMLENLVNLELYLRELRRKYPDTPAKPAPNTVD